jgi:hypothetical protein
MIPRNESLPPHGPSDDRPALNAVERGAGRKISIQLGSLSVPGSRWMRALCPDCRQCSQAERCWRGMKHRKSLPGERRASNRAPGKQQSAGQATERRASNRAPGKQQSAGQATERGQAADLSGPVALRARRSAQHLLDAAARRSSQPGEHYPAEKRRDPQCRRASLGLTPPFTRDLCRSETPGAPFPCEMPLPDAVARCRCQMPLA